MSVTLQFYGRLGDLMGRERELAPGAAATISDFVRRLEAENQSFGNVSKNTRLRFALNDVIVGGDALVRDGDVIALLPPFSGG